AGARAFFEDFVNRYTEWRDAVLAWWQSWQLTRRPWSPEQVQAFRAIVDDFEDRTKTGSELTERQQEGLALAREFLDRIAQPEHEGRPRQILDVSAAHQMLDSITRIVERIERVRAANAISRPDLLRIMAEMGRVVEAHVKDTDTRDKITGGWLAIRVA
ncbi:MAG: hypothetical protein H0W29_18850, partial [Gemmatimonadales bacterium]|nr:hypothetical protein [Gemmatimonadales bacterium]